MSRKPHLVCLREPIPEVLEAIRAEWPDEHRVELSATHVLVAHKNGGASVYDLIQKHLSDGKLRFKALIVRVGQAHHGYESRSLWEWLEERI